MALTEEEKQNIKMGIVLAVLLIVAGMVYYRMMVRPAVQTINDKIEKKKEAVGDLESELKQINTLLARREQIEALHDKVVEFKKRLPSAKEPIQFYSTITDSLKKSGVDYTETKPLEAKPYDQYTEYPYQISGNCGFHELGKFINLIEEDPNRFMRVKELTIALDKESPSTHNFSISVATFSIKDLPRKSSN